MIESDDDLVAALQALPREMAPPVRVAAAVWAKHASLRPLRSRAAVRIAIAASLLVLTFVAGRLSSRPASGAAPAVGREFVFLLYGGAPAGKDDRAQEYAAWAADLRRQGVPVSGERLGNAAWIAGDALPARPAVRGFFIVRARDANTAVELAWRHPHAREGTIEVRPIDTP